MTTTAPGLDEGDDMGRERARANRGSAAGPHTIGVRLAVGIEALHLALLAQRQPSDLFAGERRVAKANLAHEVSPVPTS